MRCVRAKLVSCLWFFGLGQASWVQADRLVGFEEPPERPSASRPLLQSSGYVFSGTVKAVVYVAPSRPGGIGITRITFHVDNAVRGVRTGQTLVVSEWAGLWQQGERYRPGEHVFLFLYPPSKLGFTSPVHGPAGRFVVGDRGRIVVRPEQRGGLPPTLAKRFRSNNDIDIGEFERSLRMIGEQQP